jgi:hypothetical protein
MLENIIAYHCGPALAGIKPANIVSCYKDRIPDIHTSIDRLNEELNGRDIYFEILCECDRRVLLMVYRSKALEVCLSSPEIRELLCSFGYEQYSNLRRDLERLKSRLGKDDFPHEIGAFLGYPIHDIYGYIHHRNEGCIFTGDWRVYERADEARELFARYSKCRRAILRRLNRGSTLARVFCAV